MTDSEFLEMSRLLDSLTKGADTLRVVFSKKTVEDKVVTSDKAKNHPDFKVRSILLNEAQNDVKALVGLINGCNDWTSSQYKASVLYPKMRAFISATSNMPKGISGLYSFVSATSVKYENVRKKVLERIDLIRCSFPDVDPFIRDLLVHPDYKKAVDYGQISPPFTWNDVTIKNLAVWLDETTLLSKPETMKVNGRTQNDWMLADCVFRFHGEPVTAEQLRNAMKH